jgi:hypothetical protein
VSTADGGDPALGLAHVASCSFLASRLAPSGQFFLALGGGIALARTAALGGMRAGYGASIAAIVQTVALIGPARVNAPLTQALNAPVIGGMHARDASRAARLAACLAIRLVHYAILNVIFVTLVVGGLDEFVDTYDGFTRFIERVLAFLIPFVDKVHVFPHGRAAALALTGGGAILYALLFSTIQVLVYERALTRWPQPEAPPPDPAIAEARAERPRGVRVWLAPALVALAWVAMLKWLDWVVLGAVAAGFLLLTVTTRARRAGSTTWRIGFALAAVLSVGALFPAIFGSTAWEVAGERAVRAALLVLTATWARAFAGTDGLREFGRRILWGESARLIAGLESDSRLRPAADDLIERFGDVDLKFAPMSDALTAWVATEARAYRPPS